MPSWSRATEAARDQFRSSQQTIVTQLQPCIGAEVTGIDLRYRVSDEKREDLRAAYPPQTHPVVRTHPETGEPNLFVNHVFTTRIVGLSDAESKELLGYLTDRVKAPEYQVRYRWSEDAVVFWDNRATQHYAVLDYWPFERVVERVTVSGTERPFSTR